MRKQPYVVLMAEDSEHDIVATRRAWKNLHIINPLKIVRDGEECLEYLYRKGKFSAPEAAPSPGLLLLDIKMPKMDGLAVLEELRASEEFRHLPVVILTTSREDEDRLRGYDLCVNAYILKPVGFSNFIDAISKINLFWEIVELPKLAYENE